MLAFTRILKASLERGPGAEPLAFLSQAPAPRKDPSMAQANADTIALFDGAILVRATRDAFAKLDPRHLRRNPVIFVTEVVAALVTVLGLRNLATAQPWGFALAIALGLWLTVLFATFAEAVAEGRGRARAESLRRSRDRKSVV